MRASLKEHVELIFEAEFISAYVWTVALDRFVEL
jgi:hypothetical protein